MARQAETLLEVCVARAGVHRGALAAANLAQYALAAADLGHVPTTVEYADWWAVTERTGWYHRERIRGVFGEDWRDVVEALTVEIARRQARSPRAVMALAVPA